MLSLFYALISFNLAMAWRELLANFEVSVSSLWAICVYGQSQIAKYLPGNFFHLVSRQSLGQSSGIKAGVLVKILFIEHMMLSLIGALSIILFLPEFISSISASIVIFAYIFSISISVILIHRYISISMATAIIYQSLFLIASGFIFVLILYSLTNTEIRFFDKVSLVYGAYVLAWLAGMLMPGAPAGIGVRELVLSILLNNYFPAADILLALVFSRFVTLCGDALFFLCALSLSIKYKPHAY